MRFILSGLLALFFLPAAAASADPSGAAAPVLPAVAAAPGCAGLPSSKLRVRLGADQSQIGDAGPTIRGIVSETWRRQGLSIEWVDDPPESSPSWDGVEAWVTLRHARADRHRADALGGAMFVDGVPNGLVFVSIDAAIAWLHAEHARLLKIKPSDYPRLSLKEAAPALHATLGHVVAHEIGHIVLGTRDHGPYGLMKASYDDVTALSRARPLPLDSHSRVRLSARLEASANCQALRASNQARSAAGRDQYK